MKKCPVCIVGGVTRESHDAPIAAVLQLGYEQTPVATEVVEIGDECARSQAIGMPIILSVDLNAVELILVGVALGHYCRSRFMGALSVW